MQTRKHNTNLPSPTSPTIDLVNWRVDDFCRAHGIGRTLFYDEVKRGEIKLIKIGKRTLVPDSEAKAWQKKKMRASGLLAPLPTFD